nr:hypothetical protein [Planctomycetota bacterium]
QRPLAYPSRRTDRGAAVRGRQRSMVKLLAARRLIYPEYELHPIDPPVNAQPSSTSSRGMRIMCFRLLP